jgi:hypothetical protein
MPAKKKIESKLFACNERSEYDEDSRRYVVCYLQQDDLRKDAQRLEICEGARSADSLLSWHNPSGCVWRDGSLQHQQYLCVRVGCCMRIMQLRRSGSCPKGIWRSTCVGARMKIRVKCVACLGRSGSRSSLAELASNGPMVRTLPEEV